MAFAIFAYLSSPLPDSFQELAHDRAADLHGADGAKLLAAEAPDAFFFVDYSFFILNYNTPF